MPTTCVVGLQWGDEAKAHVLDVYSERADCVVRSQGGNNAGHTVVVGDEKYVFHLVPTGILRPGVLSVIGNGLVVDLKYLLREELAELRRRGIEAGPENLAISDRAHVVLPYHRLFDGLSEKARGGAKIDTTLRGVGPCYADKAARTGIRIADLYEPELLKERLQAALAEKNALLRNLYDRPELDWRPIYEEYLEYADELRPMVRNTQALLLELIDQGKSILLEGAQATLLDLDHGTYPFVTSSNSSVYGALSGSGVPPRCVDSVVGVLKAYTTRVGAGPFPTELSDETGEKLQTAGDEFGATTGRPRRCGWLDLVAARYTTRLNGTDEIALTKLDILSGLNTVKVCTEYRVGDTVLDGFPAGLAELRSAEPVYKELPGWSDDVARATSFGDLPATARAYVEYVEEALGTGVTMVCVGPERSQVIFR
jgi:adenylosuccinate synthase